MCHGMDYRLIKHKISRLRDENDEEANEFRALVEEIAMLMGYEALSDLPTEEVQVKTPIETCKTPVIAGRKLAVVPIHACRTWYGKWYYSFDQVPTAEDRTYRFIS